MFTGKIRTNRDSKNGRVPPLLYIEEAEELEQSVEKVKKGISICRIGNSPRQSKINIVKNIMPTRPLEEKKLYS